HQPVVAAAAAQRLHRHGRREQILPLAAVLGRDGQPEQPELRALLPALARKAGGGVAALELVVELGARELEHGVVELALLGAQLEIHALSFCAGRPAARPAPDAGCNASIQPMTRANASRWRRISTKPCIGPAHTSTSIRPRAKGSSEAISRSLTGSK